MLCTLHSPCVSFLYINPKAGDLSIFCSGCIIWPCFLCSGLKSTGFFHNIKPPYFSNHCLPTKSFYAPVFWDKMGAPQNGKVVSFQFSLWRSHVTKLRENKMWCFSSFWEKLIAQKDGLPAAVSIFIRHHVIVSTLKSTIEDTLRDSEEVRSPQVFKLYLTKGTLPSPDLGVVGFCVYFMPLFPADYPDTVMPREIFTTTADRIWSLQGSMLYHFPLL